MLGTGDARYFTTTQLAGQLLAIHLKPDDRVSSPSQNFDLYASTLTSVPNPTGYQWKSMLTGTFNGKMREDTILVPAPTANRSVNFSVYSQNGAGGYRVYANNVPRIQTLKVATDFNYKSPTDYTSTITSALRAATGAIYSATDGTLYVGQWDLYRGVMAGGANVDTACGGTKCHYVIWQNPAVCGGPGGGACTGGSGYSCFFGGPLQHVNDCYTLTLATPYAGYSYAHEFGHCYYKMEHDEYNWNTPTGPNRLNYGQHCGHSIMSDQATSNFNDYCTVFNHQTDPYQSDGTTSAQMPLSGWDHMQACDSGQVAHIYGTSGFTAPDPEMWYDTDAFNSGSSLFVPVIEH